MKRRDEIILQKIISEIDFASTFLERVNLEEFLENEVMKRAIGMTSINVGELVKNLSAEFRTNHPQVDWREIAGFRDIVAHKYETLRMTDVYNTIKKDFPELKAEIEKIFEKDRH